MFAYHTSWLHRISFIPLWLHRFVLPDDVAPNGSRKLCWRMFQWLHSFICLLSFILFTIVNEKIKLQQDRRDKIASKRATLVCTLHIPIFFSFIKVKHLSAQFVRQEFLVLFLVKWVLVEYRDTLHSKMVVVHKFHEFQCAGTEPQPDQSLFL